MAEYIERESTLERIKNAYCTGCESYNGIKCSACGIMDAMDLVDDAPEINLASLWRDASTPPPTHVDEWDDGPDHYRFEVSDEVWIYCIDGTRLLGRYDKENGWFESNGPQISNSYHGCVTHWMPLPETPKGVA